MTIATISAVATAWLLAEMWFPAPLLASGERKTFPFGGRRRERDTPLAEDGNPELLGDVAEGHYGGGRSPRPGSSDDDASVPGSPDRHGPLPTILVPVRDRFEDPARYDEVDDLTRDGDGDGGDDDDLPAGDLGPWPDATRGPAATEPFPHAFDTPREPFDDLASVEEPTPTELPSGRMPWLSLPAGADVEVGSDDDPLDGARRSADAWAQPIELGAGVTNLPVVADEHVAIEVADHAAADRFAGEADEPVREIARWALQRLIDHDEADRRLELAQAPPPESLVEHALYAAAMDAHVAGTVTPAIDELVETFGFNVDLTDEDAWRLGARLDTRLAAYCNRTLAHTTFPYLFLTTIRVKVHEGSRGHAISRTAAIVMGITDNGDREVLAVDIGNTQDDARWNLLLLDLRRRGLSGTRLVVSDAHEGLRSAIRASLPAGVTWQFCRVHYGRRFAAHFTAEERPGAEADLAAVFDSDRYDEIEARWHELVLNVADRHADLAEQMLLDGPDLLAFTWFPVAHWRKIASTSVADAVARSMRKQLRTIGAMPNADAARRLLAASAAEQHARFADARRILTGVSATDLDAVRNARRTHEAGEPLTGVDRRRADRRSKDRRDR